MAKKTSRSTAMPKLDASQRVVILRGPDPYLRDAHTRRLVEALTAAHGEIEQFKFDGTSTEPAVVLDELRSYGLLQTHKLVIVDEADKFLAGVAAGRAKSPRELMEKYAAGPVESATLLLRAETWRPGRLDKAVTAGGGAIIKCDEPNEVSARQFCVARGEKEHNCRVDPEAATLLVGLIGPKLARLDTELGKLATFVGDGGTIGVDTVRSMVGMSREEKAWSIQSALLTGDPREAIGKLRDLMRVPQQETMLSWAIIDLMRKIHAASQLSRERTPDAEIARTLKLWGAGTQPLLRAAKGMPPATAARLLQRTVEADRGNKRGYGSAARTLEVLAVEIADTMGRATSA